MQDFDFDKWVELYKNDPDDFERQKAAEIENAIVSLCDDKDRQERMRAMMHNLELNLDKFVDPVARFNEVQRRFYQQVGKFKVAVNSPEWLELQKRFDNVVKFDKTK